MSINSKYAEIFKPLNIENKECYKIKDYEHLKKVIEPFNDKRLSEGSVGIWERKRRRDPINYLLGRSCKKAKARSFKWA
ncbi:MAG: hypothetical protein ACTSRT_19360 [Promethearchaeota archaeon]